jgi:hypothetical protein
MTFHESMQGSNPGKVIGRFPIEDEPFGSDPEGFLCRPRSVLEVDWSIRQSDGLAQMPNMTKPWRGQFIVLMSVRCTACRTEKTPPMTVPEITSEAEEGFHDFVFAVRGRATS